MKTEIEDPRNSPPATAEDALKAALAASKSPSTRRAYRTAWNAWTDWRGRQTALHADPEDVALYLAARFDRGAGLATLRMACAAISEAHRLAGQPNPCGSAIVSTAMQGFVRQSADAGVTVKQAKGLTAEAVATVRGHLEGRIGLDPKAARDMAICSLMAEAGLRRSEAAALTWADVFEEADGSGRVAVRRSKTDQAAEGAVVAVTRQAMLDLARHKQASGVGDPDAPVFSLTGEQIATRLAAAAEAAGLGSGFSGHSGRVGMAQRMTRNGAPAAAVMRQGRWQSMEMVARYTRNEAAGEALRYL